MNTFIKWLGEFWDAIKPDPYFHIASVMQLEGYTEFEIQTHIRDLKRANGDQ